MLSVSAVVAAAIAAARLHLDENDPPRAVVLFVMSQQMPALVFCSLPL